MSDRSFSKYDPRDFPPVAVTVDVVLFTIIKDALHVLLTERRTEPFLGSLALPGGFVHPDENLDAAAARELAEGADLDSGVAYLEQLCTYGAPNRDPRMRVVTVAYWAVCNRVPDPAGGGNAVHSAFVPVSRIEEGAIELAFDHQHIATYALERLRAKLEYTALAARFCEPEFTISELRKVYEAVWNEQLDPGNFQRKVRDNHAFVMSAREGAVQSTQSEVVASRSVCSLAGESAAGQQELGENIPETANRTYRVVFNRYLPMHRTPMHRLRRETPVVPKSQSLPPMASPGPRGGRPASLWTAVDPTLRLNSPIQRRGSPPDTGTR